MIVHEGGGLVNSLINNLPLELHIPGGYKFCGPGTRLRKRLARGDVPKNPLDRSCRAHDIAYSQNPNDLEARHRADEQLADEAWRRVKASDASLGERAAAAAVTGVMRAKRAVGAGHHAKRGAGQRKKRVQKKKRKFGLGVVVKNVKKHNLKTKLDPMKTAVMAARKAVKTMGGKKQVLMPRVLPVPKIGGAIPLIPIFAALSAAGALSGGLANVAKAINETRLAAHQLKEQQRHNQRMEEVTVGKGLYLKPYKKGLGLHLTARKN